MTSHTHTHTSLACSKRRRRQHRARGQSRLLQSFIHIIFFYSLPRCFRFFSSHPLRPFFSLRLSALPSLSLYCFISSLLFFPPLSLLIFLSSVVFFFNHCSIILSYLSPSSSLPCSSFFYYCLFCLFSFLPVPFFFSLLRPFMLLLTFCPGTCFPSVPCLLCFLSHCSIFSPIFPVFLLCSVYNFSVILLFSVSFRSRFFPAVALSLLSYSIPPSFLL